MTADKHLVVDVSTVLEQWFNPKQAQATDEFFNQARALEPNFG